MSASLRVVPTMVKHLMHSTSKMPVALGSNEKLERRSDRSRHGLLPGKKRNIIPQKGYARKCYMPQTCPALLPMDATDFEEAFSLTRAVQPQRLHNGFDSADAGTKACTSSGDNSSGSPRSAFRSLRKGFQAYPDPRPYWWDGDLAERLSWILPEQHSARD